MKQKSRNKIKNSRSYKKLLTDITKIIEGAQAKGVSFSERYDLLDCNACGAYEDEAFDGEQMVMLKNEQRRRKGNRFIVISRKEKSRSLKSGVDRYYIFYEYICVVCGAYQSAKLIEDFKNERVK